MASITSIESLLKRTLPEELLNATLGGNGRVIFCDPANGNDNSQGRTPFAAVATLPTAFGLATANKNDTIILIGDGNTTGTARLSASLDWNKDATHLIGVTAPTRIANRARISTATGATTNLNPLMTVSADGCIFKNFSFFQGVGQASTDEQLIDVTGLRNYFEGIHFGGMGHTNGATRAGSYIMQLSGAEENLFKACTFGLDTIARSGANATIKFRSAAARNQFEDCLFLLSASAGTPLTIDANAANSIDRWNLFKRSTFLASDNISPGGDAPDVLAVGHASQNGTILLDGCSLNNYTDVAASGALVRLANMAVTVGNADNAGSFADSAAS